MTATAVYLSTTEVAARLGITRAAVSKYHLPPPDATIGTVRGWLPETIDRWNRERPGQGACTDRRKAARRAIEDSLARADQADRQEWIDRTRKQD